jgi:protein-disulfide isomerase-like protein with CxxC motif
MSTQEYVEKPRDHDAVRVRIVQTGERQGFPILVCEAAGEFDAMGRCQWHKADLPWQIIAALLLKASRGDVRSAENFA